MLINCVLSLFQMSYAVFLIIYTYMVLQATPVYVPWFEVYGTAFVFSFGCERFREFMNYEPNRFS